MSSPTPTVSVVMPVYNSAGYVAGTIDSILAQTFSDFELLILDDGSTDETPAILKRYADRDSRVKVITRENRGIVQSRNELIAAASGQYMAANDADDLSVPDRLEKQVAYLQSNPDCVLLGSRVVVMDPFGSPLYVSGQKLAHDEIEKELLGNGGGWAIVQSSMICVTEAARKVGGYRGEHPVFSEDHDFYLRMAELGKVANLPEPLVWYRRHHANTTSTYYLEKAQKHAETRERVLREAHERRGKPFPAEWKFSRMPSKPHDEQARLWGWAALKHGNVAIARKHAKAAVRSSPLKPASWRLWVAAHRRSTDTKGQLFPTAYRTLTHTMTTNPDHVPTVSVLMSVYNGGAFLRPCVESILNQTFTDFEFIIIDDGSKDDSPAVLKEYADRDPRIKLVVRPNKGLTKTLNEAYHLSRGKYLARMDCDDVAVPTRFAAQVAFMDKHPEVSVAGGYFQLIDGESRLLTTLRPPTEDAAVQAECLAGHNPICHPSAMIRRSAMDAVNGYDERFRTTQDLDLWLRLGEVGKLANVPEVVLQFRLHESSVSETKREEQRKAGELAVTEAWERRNVPPENRKFEASEPWRPGKDRASRHQHALQYGWWAFNSGQRKTAVHYGWKAISAMPLNSKGWRLVAVAMLKTPKAA